MKYIPSLFAATAIALACYAFASPKTNEVKLLSPAALAATNTPALIPTFADGVVIAAAVLRSNPGFATLLTSQEQVALCARVWQQQHERGGGK